MSRPRYGIRIYQRKDMAGHAKKCSKCGTVYDAEESVCPSCGSDSIFSGRPQTIEELRQYCMDHGLTAEKTRFFVGEDYRSPKAFGIYKNGSGQFVVYKNKANGERAVRYQGPDEAFAVNELYERLQQEIANQRALSAVRRSGEGGTKKSSRRIRRYVLFIVIAIYVISVFFSLGRVHARGYYQYDEALYYCLQNVWYYWNTATDTWDSLEKTSLPQELSEHPRNYFSSTGYESSYDADRFEDTDTYQTWEERVQSRKDNNDNDDDWDFDWDTGGTDWDSDW